ncbi:hypothetical protein A176_004514 [Myxococcus hansupus]|uniref:Uncharacterized protein n=1 Tax=Pseudomyxococcus hansupus TaxID=1297742 RepID=A0A0H4XHB2_9BACT|nr:hypothetical protein [Myxococcus hansupus]AKQ67602.1 hypothetical protein A176_004514 [Myxococcus hansupus]
MIDASKMRSALSAINAVLVGARYMAYQGRAHSDIAWVLDVAEYLPVLMLESTDRTQHFRDQLVALSEKYPEFGDAVFRFDSPA